jgi:hypothetical protein
MIRTLMLLVPAACAVKVSYLGCEVYGLYREMHVAVEDVD